MNILKKQSLKNIAKIACVYSGAILGAGFASGKEITQYFICYGQNGFYGLILSGILFGITGWAVMDITYRHNIKSYREFIDMLLGKTLGNIMEYVSVIFMFILFATMLSAMGAIVNQNFNISPQLAILSLAFVSVITFIFDMKGIVIVNSIVSPVLLVGGTILGLYSFIDKTILTSTGMYVVKNNWVMSSLIYVAYNVITSISVLSTMGSMVDCRKTAKYGGLCGGFTLGAMGICLGLGIIVNYDSVYKLQLPVLQIATQYGITIQICYIFLLILAIYTTAVVNGYSAIKWATKRFKIKKSIFIFIFTVLAIAVAQLEFSDFVTKVYPLFGYIGIFQICVIFINFISVYN